ncbi:metal ABC transporter permease [Candidatus Dependentiae bacterium]|nr:metal ABC transporter permease [Candidatus Dependentiae bacterium]
MNITFLYLQLIATTIFTAIACCIPGTFLILRGTSLISDAISHAIFLGIVISFLIFKQLYTPILFFGGTITALSTIWIIEYLIKTQKLKADAVIGIIFPFLFSIGALLINLYAQNIHLDIDAVLLGELAFSPFYQIIWSDILIGSYALWTMGIILIFNLFALWVLYKKLILSTFDPEFAQSCKYNVHKIHWILMVLTCITILAAFEATGAILIISFIIIPPATAYLVSKSIDHMILIGILISILGSISGCLFANLAQTSIAGSITTVYSIIFFLAYLYFIKAKRLY